MKTFSKTIWAIVVFSIAMAFMESAVVVYLRELYYPNRFDATLHPMTKQIAITELLRELATIIMLLYLGIMNGKNFAQRFAYFLMSFAIWDIFYYVFLKLILDWPAAILDWDILFLIPVPWFGPVLAPCLISATMIVLACLILSMEAAGHAIRIKKSDWTLMICVALLFIISFTLEYFQAPALLTTEKVSRENFYQDMRHFIPSQYNWYLFSFAEAILLGWMHYFRKRNLRQEIGYRELA